MKPYISPKACYTKAPVRRETERERLYRMSDQLGPIFRMSMILDAAKSNTGITVNRDLEPGEAKYVKDPVIR